MNPLQDPTTNPQPEILKPKDELEVPSSFAVSAEPNTDRSLCRDQASVEEVEDTVSADEATTEDDWEEVVEAQPPSGTEEVETGKERVVRVRRRKRQLRSDAVELRLQGRRTTCMRITDIAARVGKQVKLRILTSYTPRGEE